MIHTTRLVTTESSASAVFAAISGDEHLASLAIDANEIAADRWQIVIYAAEPFDPTITARLRDITSRILHVGGDGWIVGTVADRDWVAKSLADLSPVRAGRFVVHGDHDRGAARPNEIGIEIGATEAFGTGHHGTTAGCLLAIDAVARSRPFRRAADIGTGSGVLAIAIAKRTKASVLASDIDGKAVAIAAANAAINGVCIRLAHTGGVGHRLFTERGPFDLVVANILAAPLAAMAAALRRRLAPKAIVILSGLLPEQKQRIVAAYRSQGLRLSSGRLLDGWLTLVFFLGRR